MTDLTQLIQGSEEWLLARCGSLGASDVPKALTTIKNGWGASRANLRADLVCERLTGKPRRTFQSQAMLDGQQREPNARAHYGLIYGVEVIQVGVIVHPRIKGTHASPDGLINDDGLLEIKCPEPKAHYETFHGACIDRDYLLQCTWQLACTGRQWVDLCSFNPDFPEDMQIVVRRIVRDEKAIAELEAKVKDFLDEVESDFQNTNRRRGMQRAAA